MFLFHLQNTDLSNIFAGETPCTRSLDQGAGIEITPVKYGHRFQVTAILQDYPFVEGLATIGSEEFTTLANKFESEVSNVCLFLFDTTFQIGYNQQ